MSCAIFLECFSGGDNNWLSEPQWSLNESCGHQANPASSIDLGCRLGRSQMEIRFCPVSKFVHCGDVMMVVSARISRKFLFFSGGVI